MNPFGKTLKLEDYRDLVPPVAYAHGEPAADDEEKSRLCDELIDFLLREKGTIAAFNFPYREKRTLLRRYMNVRPPAPLPASFLAAQDKLYWTETLERGTVDADALEYREGIALFAGDITRLNADAIVNSASSVLTGCAIPLHDCVDNVIHSRAGAQLRNDCAAIINRQGHDEQPGGAKITLAYNLPAKYILHTVGPRVEGRAGDEDRALLRSCYLSCLSLAAECGLKSVAFCCISTGMFNFPPEEAAETAVGAARQWRMKNRSDMKIIFDVFTEEDRRIYSEILRFM